MKRFNRTYRINIGQAGGDGISIGPPFTMSFRSVKTRRSALGETEITLMNLSDETVQKMAQPDAVCLLYAGHTEAHGPILVMSGNITELSVRREGVDKIVTLKIKSGYVPVRDSASSFTVIKGGSAHRALELVAEDMGLGIFIEKGTANKIYDSGFTFFGSSHEALTKICRASGLEWSIQNGVIRVAESRKAFRNRSYLVSPSTGLIGTPELNVKASREKKILRNQKNTEVSATMQAEHKYIVTTLLMPEVVPGNTVAIESSTANGVYRIDEIQHTAEYPEGEWRTVMEVSPAELA